MSTNEGKNKRKADSSPGQGQGQQSRSRVQSEELSEELSDEQKSLKDDMNEIDRFIERTQYLLDNQRPDSEEWLSDVNQISHESCPMVGVSPMMAGTQCGGPISRVIDYNNWTNPPYSHAYGLLMEDISEKIYILSINLVGLTTIACEYYNKVFNDAGSSKVILQREAINHFERALKYMNEKLDTLYRNLQGYESKPEDLTYRMDKLSTMLASMKGSGRIRTQTMTFTQSQSNKEQEKRDTEKARVEANRRTAKEEKRAATAAADVRRTAIAERRALGNHGITNAVAEMDPNSIPPTNMMQHYYTEMPSADTNLSRSLNFGETPSNSSVRSKLGGDAQIECGNTLFFRWPRSVNGATDENREIVNKFSPSWYYQDKSICYMTFVYFVGLTSGRNAIYPSDPPLENYEYNGGSHTMVSLIRPIDEIMKIRFTDPTLSLPARAERYPSLSIAASNIVTSIIPVVAPTTTNKKQQAALNRELAYNIIDEDPTRAPTTTTGSGAANVLLRLECEHVIPFDNMLFYFGCESTKWNTHAIKCYEEINIYNPRAITPSLRDNMIQKTNGLHLFVYDYSLALANQWKSSTNIINLSLDHGSDQNILKMELNEEVYGLLLNCIFNTGGEGKTGMIPWSHDPMQPPPSTPYTPLKSYIIPGNDASPLTTVGISIKTMWKSGLYGDLKVFDPTSMVVKDLQNINDDDEFNILYNNILEKSTELLKIRCSNCLRMANNDTVAYDYLQKFYVLVIIKSISEISALFERIPGQPAGTLSYLLKVPKYLKYSNYYRGLFGLPRYRLMNIPASASASTASAAASATTDSDTMSAGGQDINPMEFLELLTIKDPNINGNLSVMDIIQVYYSCENDEEFIDIMQEYEQEEMSHLSTIPEGNESTIPEGNESTIPEGNESTIPDENESTIPEGNESTIPEGNESTIPDENESTIPDENESIQRQNSSVFSEPLGPQQGKNGGKKKKKKKKKKKTLKKKKKTLKKKKKTLKKKKKTLKKKKKTLKKKKLYKGGAIIHQLTIPINDILYQSYGSMTPENAKYPAFFAITPEVANLYVGISPNSICKIFKNNKDRHILKITGRDTYDSTRVPVDRSLNQLIPRIISHIQFSNPEEKIIFENILIVFFGQAENIMNVMESITILERHIGFIKNMLNFYNSDLNRFAGFNPDINKAGLEMLDTLKKYKDKIIYYQEMNPNMTILPSRTTNRNWDMLFCNIFKFYGFRIPGAPTDGFWYDPPSPNELKASYDNNHITFNEVLQGVGMTVPPEICLLEGYEYLEDVGRC